MAEPTDVIAALDLLNSHARAYGCGKDAIYAYKSLMALRLVITAEATVRPVAMMSKCLGCDGTGKWISLYDGPTNERCRKCWGAGHVHLRFAETSVRDVRWHHPYERQGKDLLQAAWCATDIEYRHRALIVTELSGQKRQVFFEGVDDWTPRNGGITLRGEQAAELLNLVEEWVIALPRHNSSWPWRFFHDSALRAIGSYNLRLDRLDETNCWRCGTQVGEGGTRMARMSGGLDFSRPTCAACHSIKPLEWPVEPAPGQMTPAVEAWLARHRRFSSQRGHPA